MAIEGPIFNVRPFFTSQDVKKFVLKCQVKYMISSTVGFIYNQFSNKFGMADKVKKEKMKVKFNILRTNRATVVK